MREIVELRVPEENASEFLPDSVGERLGDSVRKVVLDSTDPLFDLVRELSHEFSARGEYFFHGWDIRRLYSAGELELAELFYMDPTAAFEPAGEECGTEYDESSACPLCGSGRMQLSELRLRTRRIPKRAEIARTIAFDEVVVSERVRDLLESIHPTGIRLPAVIDIGRTRPDTQWFQLRVVAPPVQVVAPTVFGTKIFEEDNANHGRCPVCTNAGLNLLSEVWVERRSWKGADFVQSVQFVGDKSGLIRPRRLLFVSPRVRRVLIDNKVRGVRFEIAHVSGS